MEGWHELGDVRKAAFPQNFDGCASIRQKEQAWFTADAEPLAFLDPQRFGAIPFGHHENAPTDGRRQLAQERHRVERKGEAVSQEKEVEISAGQLIQAVDKAGFDAGIGRENALGGGGAAGMRFQANQVVETQLCQAQYITGLQRRDDQKAPPPPAGVENP